VPSLWEQETRRAVFECERGHFKEKLTPAFGNSPFTAKTSQAQEVRRLDGRIYGGVSNLYKFRKSASG